MPEVGESRSIVDLAKGRAIRSRTRIRKFLDYRELNKPFRELLMQMEVG